MPELPEVQTILGDLKQAKLVGRSIQKVNVHWEKTIALTDVGSFSKAVVKQQIIELSRRGKFLIFHLSNAHYIVVHLRMTGRLQLVPSDTETSPYVRVSLDLDTNQQLRFHDTRKFGRWYLTSNLESFFKKLGPEPLDPSFTLDRFISMFKGKKRSLKPLLLDQTFLAGLGNIYVDEALWRAQLHPLQKADTLDKKQIKHLYEAIVFVLRRGIESQGTTLGTGKTNYYRLSGSQGKHQTLLQVFRRTGYPCERCGSTIQRLIVAQRGTHICPHCQKFDT